MKQMPKRWSIAIIGVVAICTTAFTEGTLMDNFTWIIQGGIKRGSIVGRNMTDGVSGATKTLWNGTAGAEVKLGRHYLETGVILGQTDQQVNFEPGVADITSTASGQNISLLLLDIPVLYNFHFFPGRPREDESSRLLLGVGAFASFVLSNTITYSGTPDKGKLSKCALGPFFRLSYYPVRIKSVCPGLYFDFYRSLVPKYFYDQTLFRQSGIAGELGTINLGLSVRIHKRATR
jgi:hypothetical protein